MADKYYKVKRCVKAPFPRKIAKKACIKEGLQFEAEMQIALTKSGIAERLLGEFHHSVWLEYEDFGKAHAQPDSFLLTPTKVFIFEMKLRHTPRSAAQLSKYAMLLAELHPNREIILVEIYKYWDWVAYPAEHERVHEFTPEDWRSGTVYLLHGESVLCSA